MTLMSNIDLIRERYTEDNIKSLGFALVDAIYDIAINTSHCTAISKSDLDHTIRAIENHASLSTDDTIVNSIIRQMSMDIDAIFPEVTAEDYTFIKSFIKAYSPICTMAFWRYVGHIGKGRLHPDDVGTNGCKEAYLFIHYRHPKHKLNSNSKDYVNLIVEDLFK